MAKKDKTKGYRLWDGITEEDFINDHNIEDIDLADYDLENMTIFSANINYFRQIVRLSDSLKPVERRILYTMYEKGLKPSSKTKKSQGVIGDASKLHAHLEPYGSLVNMAQPWKRPCPLIAGKGNFGSDQFPEIFAAMRYTECTISKYAYECFFEDYDPDCVETIFNSASDAPEPMSLPSRYPNILVNGAIGIAVGNAFCIPTFNINDIVDNCKKVLENPDTPSVFMIPDIPTGCDIIDDGHSFADIVNEGKGTLKMRSTTEIIENNKTWTIKILNLPWMVSLTTINNKLVELSKEGVIPIKDIQNASYPVILPDGSSRTSIDYRVIIDKSHDPYQILEKMYRLTQLEKPLAINFKVVLEELVIGKLSLKDLISSWIDERRSYKRRLYNKRLTRISARIDLLEILIYLLKEENIEKTLKIIKNSDSHEVVSKLMKHGKMNSHQATKIADMKLSAFTKDARKRYKEEKAKLEVDKKELMDLIGSEKKIDKIIGDELEGLRKYAQPRRSNIIAQSTGRYIPDIDYNIIITKQNLIKKIPVDKENPKKNHMMGSFKNLDFPIDRITINNLRNLIFIDSFGRYSSVPVSEIDTTELSNYGNKIYDVTGLSGNIISMVQHLNDDAAEFIKSIGTPYVVTLSADGYIKKTPLADLLKIRSTKNIRISKLRDKDYLVFADIIIEQPDTKILLYTKTGRYSIIHMSEVSEQKKDSSGVIGMKVSDGDECLGMHVIGKGDEFVVVLTEHGNFKKCEMQYLGEGSRRGTNGSYLTALDKTDKVFYVNSIPEDGKLAVFTRSNYHIIDVADIPTLTRRAKCKRGIPPSEGNIVRADIIYPAPEPKKKKKKK